VNGVTDQGQVGSRKITEWSGVERSQLVLDGGTLNHFDKRNGTPCNVNVMNVIEAKDGLIVLEDSCLLHCG
jgi:hypothetical protein